MCTVYVRCERTKGGEKSVRKVKKKAERGTKEGRMKDC